MKQNTKKSAKKIDSNSNRNQEIKGKFVSREVLTCFSYEMEAVLRASSEHNNKDYPLPTYDDIENMYEYKCPECGEGFQTVSEYEKDHETETAVSYKCPNCEKTFDGEPESEPQEVCEWWIVTSYLYDKLKEKGQVVLEWGNNCYWGRCTTGQAILLDGIITDICKDMEILEGQANEWSI